MSSLRWARSLTAERSGPVLVSVNAPAALVRITADPACTTARLDISATTDDPALADAIDRVTLRWDDMGALLVQVPDLPASVNRFGNGSVTVVQNVGTVVAGAAVTGLVIGDGGDVYINGNAVGGSGTVITGTIEITATVPVGSNIDLRGTSTSLQASGEYGDVTARTVSGAVMVEAAHRLTVKSTSGSVTASAIDSAATVCTVSGRIELDGFSGRGEFRTTSGCIRVIGRGAAAISARSVSGNIDITSRVPGVSVTASSLSGRVTTPDTHSTTARRTGRVGGDWR
jgi:hypothetical protein